ncbi:MAG: PP2C family protein-serine/threonine phosphatase [Solirubrobacteraceae bacterium]
MSSSAAGGEPAVRADVHDDAHAPRRRRHRRGPSAQASLALLLGLLTTAALAVAAQLIYGQNESRILRLRGRELDLVLASFDRDVESPLASAVELADATGGGVGRFDALVAPYAGPGRTFASISLWSLSPLSTRPLAVLGRPPALLHEPSRVRAVLLRARASPGLEVSAALRSATPSLDYTFARSSTKLRFAVYAESLLPPDRRLQVPKGDGLAGLNYALYLGRSRRERELLLTNLPQPPAAGAGDSFVVPFANSALTLVVTPNGSISGAFFAALPWIIGGGGALITLLGAALADRLVQRRDEAEALALSLDATARENRALYREQRSIAQTLQHSLLPEKLPKLDGLTACARYVSAAAGVDIGGDWYDLLAVSEQEALLMIGDVAGHGLQAASTMAALRHTMLAYAAQDPSPARVLERLAEFVSSAERPHFATTVCILLDRGRRRLVLASAGHPPPLLIEAGRARFVEIAQGMPIGVARSATYRETSLSIADGATLILYTDGLIERRGESLDVGMKRLRLAADAEHSGLEQLIDRLARELASENNDDTAILGVRWQT